MRKEAGEWLPSLRLGGAWALSALLALAVAGGCDADSDEADAGIKDAVVDSGGDASVEVAAGDEADDLSLVAPDTEVERDGDVGGDGCDAKQVDTAVEEVSVVPEDPFLVAAQLKVDAFRALCKELEVPDSLRRETGDGPLKDAGSFDPNTFLSVLDRISMEDGWVLDYIYTYRSDLGGYPSLVARAASSPPCQQDPAALCVTEEVWGHLVVEPGKEGLFQVLVLRVMGEQFYRHWHFSQDYRLVLTQQALDAWKSEQLQAVDVEMKEAFQLGTEALVVHASAEMTETGLVIDHVRVGWNSEPFRGITEVAADAPHELVGHNSAETGPLIDCFWCVTP